MRYDALVSGLAVTLAAITVVFAVLGVVYSPPILFVAAMFAAATYFVYYHASGRLADRVYRRVERQAAKNAAGARGGRRGPGRRADAGGPSRADGGGGSQRGGFGAGPREEWVPPRDGASARQAADGQRGGGTRGARHRARGGQQQRQRQQRRQRRRRPGERPPATGGPTPAEAYRRLGLEPGADETDVKAAYRQKVKETHPDTDDGDEEAFKEITAAYERLTD